MFCHLEIMSFVTLKSILLVVVCILGTFKLSKIMQHRKLAELRTKFESLNSKHDILKLGKVCHL